MNNIQPQANVAASNNSLNSGNEPQKLTKSFSEQVKLKATEEVLKALTQKAPEPAPAPKKPQQGYLYEAAWGPFKVRCLSTYDADLKNIDKILMFLDDPDVKTVDSYLLRITSLQNKFGKRLSRLWNFLFGDHHWYNESCARKLIKHFANDFDEKNKTEDLRGSILKVHDRLADIRRGNGTWAKGIDRSLLEQQSLLQRSVFLLQSMPEWAALKQTAQTVGRIALMIGKLWITDQAQKRFGQEKVPYLDVKATDLTQILMSSLIKI